MLINIYFTKEYIAGYILFFITNVIRDGFIWFNIILTVLGSKYAHNITFKIYCNYMYYNDWYIFYV